MIEALTRIAMSLSWPARILAAALKPFGLEALAPFLYALIISTLFYLGARLVRRDELDRVLTASLAALWVLVVILVGVAMVVSGGG